MRATWRRWGAFLPALATAVLFPACGGGGGSTGPNPVNTPPPGSPVTGVVFYDENGNGTLDASETVRLPGVTVNIGGRTGQSESGGAFTVNGVASGSQTAKAQTVPPFFLAGAGASVSVPQTAGAPVFVPAALPTGTNTPNRFMAFGDSISAGEGSSDDTGYRSWLEADLRAYWGKGEVRNEGQAGTRSNAGERRIDGSLARTRPAYTLIVYGTNDWNELDCKVDFPCYTVDALRSMVRQAKDRNSLPVLGTIPPVNTTYADRSPAERQDWVKRMNDLIRPMAAAEGAVLADIHAAMLRENDLAGLFTDHVHPNDRGYQIIGREWFRAITTASVTAAAWGAPTDLDASLFVPPAPSVAAVPGGRAASRVRPR